MGAQGVIAGMPAGVGEAGDVLTAAVGCRAADGRMLGRMGVGGGVIVVTLSAEDVFSDARFNMAASDGMTGSRVGKGVVDNVAGAKACRS